MIETPQKSIAKLKNDWGLRLYGAALALTHVWTFLYWHSNSFFVNSQSSINAEPLCFPIFPNCDLFRSLISSEFWQLILYAYLFLSVLSVCFFLMRKTESIAYWLLAFVTLTKFSLHMSNYNFMGNYHYMVYFVTFAFLFLSDKRRLIQYLVVAFYIAAGSLKINIDWLSGAAMISSPYISGSLLSLSLIYVIFLELILVFGLLHPNRWVRAMTLLQFIAFHVFSWHIVGFYYPMVMFSLLSIFIIDGLIPGQPTLGPSRNLLMDLFQFRASKVVYATLLLFILLQVTPFFLVKDPSLSGVPRLSSLNMFDAKTDCHILLVGHSRTMGDIHIRRASKNLGVRLKCDPIVYLNQAHQLCRKNKKFKELDRLSLTLFSKRITATEYSKVLSIKDVCALKNPLWAELSQEANL